MNVIFRKGVTTLFTCYDTRGAWCISPDVSAQRATALIGLLQILLHNEGELPF